MKNRFSSLPFVSVSGICRKKAVRRAVAGLTAFSFTTLGAMSAYGFAGQVLQDVNGGAVISGTSGNVTVAVGAGLNSAVIGLDKGTSGLIDWSALNVGSGQSLDFQGGQFFNVVSGSGASKIAGTLQASGALWIFNPNGISFMDGANVNVGSLFAVAAGLGNRSEIETAINSETAVPDPAIGDVLGKIAVSGGEFAGNASLVGKGVDISGAARFNGNLQIVAGGKVTIDTVGDGRVDIDISDFTEGDDINIGEAGGLNDVETKDLEIVTKGDVNVNEAVKADGDIHISGGRPSGGDPVVGVRQMTIASGKLLQGKSVSAFSAGNITAAGDISATGDVVLDAAGTIELNGSVAAYNVFATDVRNGGEIAVYGDIVVDGVMESNGKVAADSGTIEADKIVVGGGTVKSWKIAGDLDQKGGDVEVDVSISGDVKVDGAASTFATGQIYGNLTQIAGSVSGNGGAGCDLAVSGSLVQDGGTLNAGTLRAGDDSVVSGAIVATDAIEAYGKTISVKSGADIKTRYVSAGTLDVDGGSVDVSAGSIVAYDVDQSGGSVKAVNVNGRITQTGGSMVVGDSVFGGPVTQRADASASITVGSINGGLVQETGNNGTVTVGQADSVVQNGGVLKGKDDSLYVSGALVQTGGTVGDANDTVTVGAGFAQTGGKLVADRLELTAGSGADVEGEVVAGEIVAGDTFTVAGGKVEAGNISGNVVQNGGVVTVSGCIAGHVTQCASAVDSLSAEEITGTLTQQAGNGASVTASRIGSVEQSGGVIAAKGNSLAVDGATIQTGGVIGDNDDTVALKGMLTQTGGEINADGLVIEGAGSCIESKVAAKTVNAMYSVDVGGAADVNVQNASFYSLYVKDGSVKADSIKAEFRLAQFGGAVEAGAIDGNVEQSGGEMRAGNVCGDIFQYGGALAADAVAGNVVQSSSGTAELEAASVSGNVTQEYGNAGTVSVSGAVAGNVSQNDGALSAGTVGGDVVQVRGVMSVDTIEGMLEQSTDGVLTAKEVSGAASVSGMVNGDGGLEFGSTLVQNAGTIDADGSLTLGANATVMGVVEAAGIAAGGTDVAVEGAAHVDVSGTIAAGMLHVAGGNVNAGAVSASIDQTGGSIDASGAIAGNIEQNGGMLAAGSVEGSCFRQLSGDATVAGTLKAAVVQEGGMLAADKIDGTLEQAADGILMTKEVSGAASVSGTVYGNGGLEFGSTLVQNGGTIVSYGGLSLGADAIVKGMVEADGVAAGEAAVTVDGAADVCVAGTVEAGLLYVADGSVQAEAVSAAVDQDGGSIAVSGTISGSVEQDGGMLAADSVDGAGFWQTSGEATVAGTLKAAVEQDGGMLAAGAVYGNVRQDGGEMAVMAEIAGNVVQNGGFLAANRIDGTFEQSADGTLTAMEVAGEATVSGTVNGNFGLAFGSGLTQNGGTIAANGNLAVAGMFTQSAGEIDAATMILGSEATQAEGAAVVAGELFLDDAASVSLASSRNDFGAVRGSAENLTVTDVDDLDLAGVSVSETLKVTSGSLTDSGANTAPIVELSVSGDATLDGDNDFAAIKGSAENLTVAVAYCLDLAGVSVSETLKVTSGSLVGSEANTAEAVELSVVGDAILDAGNDFGFIRGSAENLSVTDVDDLDLAGVSVTETLKVTSASLTDSAGNAARTVELSVAGGATLDNGNSFGSVKGSAENLTVTDLDDLDLAGVSVSQTLKVTSGSLTDSAANTASDVVLAVSGDVKLNNDNSFDTVTGTAENLIVRDGDDLYIADIDVTADARVKAEGRLMVSGALAADGDVLLEAGDGITVDAPVEGVNVTVATSFGDVETTSVGTLSATEDLYVNAAGSIMLSGSAAAAETMGLVAEGGIEGGSVSAKTLYTRDGAGVSVVSAAAEKIAQTTCGDIDLKIDGGATVSLKAAGTVSVEATGEIAVGPAVEAGNDLTVTEVIFPRMTTEAVLIDASDPGTSIDGVSGASVTLRPGGGGDTVNPRRRVETVPANLCTVESFLAHAPEFKSELSVWGDPLFLHADIGAAAPLAAGAIDHLHSGRPRVELAGDFPGEVDTRVFATGLNPATSYWFGRNPSEK